MIIFRVLDIETIPDLSMWAKHDVPSYKLVPGLLTHHGLPPAAVEKAESFPPAQAHRVVAISYVDIAFDPGQTPKYKYDTCYSECCWGFEEKGLDIGERKLLARFNIAMSPPEGGSAVHLVSWNGRTFDLPVIVLRSLKHKLSCAWYYKDTNVRYRYSAEGHLDLMDYLSDFGACRQMSLHDACRLAGLPGKSGEVSGGNIHDLYKRSHQPHENAEKIWRDVARYCLSDSIQTALLFLRSRFHIGRLGADAYNAAVESFASNPSIVEAIGLDWNVLKI